MIASNKKFIPQPILNDQKQYNIHDLDQFPELLNNINSTIKEGTVVKGQVVDITKNIIVIDVGLKNEGRIPIEEFKIGKNTQIPQFGDIVDVYVEKIENKHGKTILSREKAIREESWIKLEEAFQHGKLVNGTIFGRVKGGFTVDLLNVVSFLPGSQVDVRPIKDISSIMGIEQPFQILKMDKKLGNIVVSRRSIVEESRSEAKAEMLSKIKEGDVLEGSVKNITDYGVFVDLGNVDGLLHVTDISWSRINHPSEVLSLGQKIKVMIIKFNEENKRISLGMKQLDKNPWLIIQESFSINKIMTGKITNITDYGAFIELKNGIEGLVHSTEISWIKSNQHPKKFLNIGQEVQFIILEIDTEKHRISLSIKQAQANPFIEFANKYPIGSVLEVPIRNITEFGIFVSLDNNIDGMIHETDLSMSNNNSELLKKFNKGDIIKCKLLSVDIEKERIALGIKQLQEIQENKSLLINIKKHDVVTCVITNVLEAGIEVELEESKALGFIKKQDLAAEKNEQKSGNFVIGERVDAKITSIDTNNNKVFLSIKLLEIEEREKAIKAYGSTDSGASLGEILGATLNKNQD